MMDIDQIDNSLYEIKQMVMVAIGATDDLIGSDVEPGFFRLPGADAEMLSFAVNLLEIVNELKERLTEPEKPTAKIFPIRGGGECA